MNTEHVLNTLNWRYAVKKFDSQKKIDPKTWNALEESLILTPSSYGLQPWKFHVITNPQLKEQLTLHSWKQKQVEECSHLVVFTCRTSIDEQYIQEYIHSIIQTRNTPAEALDGYKKMMGSDLINGPRSKWIKEWAARQVYIALGNFMTTAALLGVDTCPMEGIVPTEYDKILGLTNSDYQTVVACPAGYRSNDDKYQSAKKVRFPADKIIIHQS